MHQLAIADGEGLKGSGKTWPACFPCVSCRKCGVSCQFGSGQTGVDGGDVGSAAGEGVVEDRRLRIGWGWQDFFQHGLRLAWLPIPWRRLRLPGLRLAGLQRLGALKLLIRIALPPIAASIFGRPSRLLPFPQPISTRYVTCSFLSSSQPYSRNIQVSLFSDLIL